MKDHVYMCISIPPKFSVSTIVGYIKGKSAISIAKNFRGKQRNFNGENFWARGYFVSTVGLDENMVIEYIRNQEKIDEHRLFWIEKGTRHTCVGDSGGPIFTDFGSGPRLVGIITAVTDPTCQTESISYGMRIDTHFNWIQQVTGGNVSFGID